MLCPYSIGPAKRKVYSDVLRHDDRSPYKLQRSTPWSIYSYPGAQMHHHHITALMIVVYAFSSRWLSTTIMHCSQEHSGLFSPWCSAVPASSDSAGELAPGQHGDQLGQRSITICCTPTFCLHLRSSSTLNLCAFSSYVRFTDSAQFLQSSAT